jgi:hypothetical protein
MGILDKVKGLVGKNEEKVDEVIDKAAEFVDDKTKGKHSDKIEKAAGKAHEVVDKLADDKGTGGAGGATP